MHGNISAAASAAISSTLGSESQSSPDPRIETLGSGSDDWFAPLAWGLLGKDAGLHLHYITGFPQSSCYSYVARDPAKRRKPSIHFLRKLFHAEQGEPFYLAFMSGNPARWWHAREDAEQRARIAEAKLLDIFEIAKRG